jgi:hypothetical protein
VSPEGLDQVLFSLAVRVPPTIDLLTLFGPLQIVFDELVVSTREYIIRVL